MYALADQPVQVFWGDGELEAIVPHDRVAPLMFEVLEDLDFGSATNSAVFDLVCDPRVTAVTLAGVLGRGVNAALPTGRDDPSPPASTSVLLIERDNKVSVRKTPAELVLWLSDNPRTPTWDLKVVFLKERA